MLKLTVAEADGIKKAIAADLEEEDPAAEEASVAIAENTVREFNPQGGSSGDAATRKAPKR